MDHSYSNLYKIQNPRTRHSTFVEIILKKLLSLPNENLVNILGGHGPDKFYYVSKTFKTDILWWT